MSAATNENTLFDRSDQNAMDDAWDDSTLIDAYERTSAMVYDKVQGGKSKTTPSSSGAANQTWKVGDACMALFEEDGKCYPAKILGIDEASGTCEIIYTDYDETGKLRLDQIMSVKQSSKRGSTKTAVASTSGDENDLSPKSKRIKTTVLYGRRRSTSKMFNQYIGTNLRKKLRNSISFRHSNYNNNTSKRNISRANRLLLSSLPKSSTEKIQYSLETSIFHAKPYESKSQSTLPTIDYSKIVVSSTSMDDNCVINDKMRYSSSHSLQQKISVTKHYLDSINERLRTEIQSKITNDVEMEKDGDNYVSDLSTEDVIWTDGDEACASHEEPKSTDPPIKNTKDSSTAKSVTANRKNVFPIPDLCPPPPPSLFGKIAQAGNNKEALTNMLMSWYMSGYHTGFYQGMQQAKGDSAGASRPGPSRNQ